MKLNARLPTARPAWAGPVGVAAVALVGLGTLAVVDPALRAEIVPGCPFRMLTGLDCPGCGATRAMFALTQGELGTALDHNVLVVALLPVLVYAWAGWLAATLGRRERAPTLVPRASMGLAVAITVFWVVRNLPFEVVARLGSGAG